MLRGELDLIGRLDPAELLLREPWSYLSAVRLRQPLRGLRTQPSVIKVDHSGTVHTLRARHHIFSSPDSGLQVIAGQPLAQEFPQVRSYSRHPFTGFDHGRHRALPVTGKET